MKKYVSPSGSPIVAVLETLQVRASISGLDAQGGPIYTGHSDVFWEIQTPVRGHDNGYVWLAEDGSKWAFNQLVFVGSDRPEPHGYTEG